MARISWKDFSRGWYPLGPGDDIPKNALREATGVRPFYGGKSIRSRYGNNAITTVGAGVQSIFIWRGQIFYNRLTLLSRFSLTNTTPTTVLNNLGGGPLRFATGIPNPDIDATRFSGLDVAHLFIVGGGLTANGNPWSTSIFPLRKLDNGFQSSPMGLDPPQDNWTLGSQPALTVVYDSFELSTHWTAVNCSKALGAQHQDGAALQVTVTSDDSGHITMNRSVNWGRNTVTFNGVTGTVDSVKQDWIRLWVHCADPSTIERIDLLVDCGGPTAIPADAEAGWEKVFSFAIYVGDNVTDTDKVKGVTDTAAGADKRDVKPYYAGGVNRPTTSFGDPAEDATTPALEVPDSESARIVDELATTKLSASTNTWTHLRIPKMLFEPSSEDMLTNHPETWSHVRRVRLVVTANDTGNAVVTFDHLDLHVGIGMQGDYKMALTAHNSITGTRSMPTAIKEIKGILRQALIVSNITVSGETSQFADEVELWRTFGNGNVLFYNKASKFASLINAQVLDFTADYEGLYEKITIPGLGEMKYLRQRILPQDNVRLSKQTFDIAGPHLGRLFSLAYDQRGRLFYSPPGRLEVAAGYIDVTDATDPLTRVVFWNTIYAFSEKHIFRLANGQEPFLMEEIHGAPGTIFVDSVVPSKFGIIYATNDGVGVFTGVTTTLIAIEAMEAYFQGTPSPNTAILDPTNVLSTHGRNALFGYVHEEEYYLSDGAKTLVVNLRTGVWRTMGVGFGPGVTEETFGHLFAVTNPKSSTGAISTIEISTQLTDGGTAIPFYIQTSEETLEDQSSATKIIQRFYFDINTNGQNLTAVALYRADGPIKVLTSTLNTATRALVEYADCLPCDVLAIRITGSLVQPVEIYGIGADVHFPEQAGQLT